MVTLTVHIYVFIYKSPSPYVCFFSANMTKKELLDILYAERNRLTSIYSRPGWTTWAIIVAIVSLAWYLIGPIYNHTFSVRISIAVCFALFNLLFVLGEGLFMILRPIQPQPLWQKGKPSMRYAQIYLFFIYFAQFIALIAYKEFSGPIWLYYTAITINIVTLLLLLINFILSFFTLLRVLHLSIYEGILEILSRTSFIALWSILIFQKSGISIESIKIGLILLAVIILIGLLNDTTKEKLRDLDKLIDKTLFEEKTEEKYIFSELEKCIIGLKYSDYLVKENYDYIIQRTQSLHDGLTSLHEILNSRSNYDNYILSVVTLSIKEVQRVKPAIESLIKMIKLGYDETNIDPALSPLIQIMDKSLEVMSVWVDVGSKISVYNYEDFRNYVGIKLKEADLIMGKLKE